jgi:multidrug efflux pump subunit AcrB
VEEMAREIQEYLTTAPNIDNPRLNISPKTLAQEVIVDARRAKIFGITPQEVAQNIGIAYEGVTVSTIISNGVQYDIKLQYDTTNHTYATLTNMKIPNKFARFVSLTEIAEIKPSLIKTDIYTENGLYSIKIQDSLYETSVLSNNSFSILADVQEKFQHYTNNLNAAPYFDSEKEEVTQGVKDISIAIVVGVSAVFLILLFMFNSFLSTFLAITGIPFIFFGLTLGLFVMQLPLNNMALIGMIALLGLVVMILLFY